MAAMLATGMVIGTATTMRKTGTGIRTKAVSGALSPGPPIERRLRPVGAARQAAHQQVYPRPNNVARRHQASPTTCIRIETETCTRRTVIPGSEEIIAAVAGIRPVDRTGPRLGQRAITPIAIRTSIDRLRQGSMVRKGLKATTEGDPKRGDEGSDFRLLND